MGSKLCDEKYYLFCETLEKNVNNIDEMIFMVGKALSILSDDYHIGRMDMEIESPISNVDHDGLNRLITMYAHRDGFEPDPYEEFFVGTDVGTMSIIVYPTSGYHWDDGEKKDIQFLAKTIYVSCGRARLLGLVHKVSMTDSLTGIPNSDGLTQFGGMLMASKAFDQYACIYINLKNFSYVNRRLGARYGDKILKAYADLLNSHVDDEDEIVARIGSDNFVAIVKKDKVQDFLFVLASANVTIMVEDIDASFDVPSHAGVYLIDKKDALRDALNCSSIALGIAKASKKDKYVWFQPHMLERIMNDKAVSAMFPKALENMEFVVYYQPKVHQGDLSIKGCEALVRWFRNDKMIPPMSFIPLLEEEGSICNLDFYVFETVCKDLRDWLDKGIEPVKTSSNFSKMHLTNPHLADDIITILEKYDLDPKYVEIELTEASGAENIENLKKFIAIMKNKGISVSLDDFGTGYSSLNLLKELDVDVIKIDKSFVDHIACNKKNDDIMVKNIVNMIRDLDIGVIAEGVETKNQLDFLNEAHCDMVQGYYFDKPLCHDDFEERLKKGSYL